MKTDKSEKRLAFFDSLYQKAKDNQTEIYERFDINEEQYRGSDKIDNSFERASAVRNITYEIIESQVSSEIPAPCVSPVRYSEKTERNAKSIERLLMQVRDALPFEEMNDMDERYTYILGGSVWLVEWDNSIISGNEKGGIKVSSLSPKDFIPEPGIYRIEDMEYCFMRFDTTRSEITNKYGLSDEESYLLSSEIPSTDEESATVIVCFYFNEERKVSKFAWCGDAVLTDIEDYYARKQKVCPVCNGREGMCKCNAKSVLKEDFDEIIDEDVILSDGSRIPSLVPFYENGQVLIEKSKTGIPLARMKRNSIRYYSPNFFPIVIRKNTSKDKSLFGQSDCEFMRCQQQQINKIESRIMQKLMRSGITPIVPDDAEVTINNQIFGQVIKLKPGEHRGKYGTIDTTPDILQDIKEADRLYEQAKRIIGISDTYQGFSDFSAQSGVAKQLQVKQSAGRLESKKKMKHSAYSKLDKIIFSYYLAYADEPKLMSYKDGLGRTHNVKFNRYDFLEYDEKKHEYYYDDSYLFSVDSNGYIEQQREYIWQKNLENLQSGTLGNPEDVKTLLRYWQCQERAHYPFARDNVEYFKALASEEQNTDDSTIDDKKDLLIESIKEKLI